jgi:hypothetical protein
LRKELRADQAGLSASARAVLVYRIETLLQ